MSKFGFFARSVLSASILVLAWTPGVPAQQPGAGGRSIEDLWKLVDDQQKEIQQLRDRLRDLETEKARVGGPSAASRPPSPAAERPENAPVRTPAAAETEDLPLRLGFLAGAASGQFGTGWGPAGAAFLDFTLLRQEPLLGQRLSGEIFLGYHESTKELDTVTSALLGPAQDVTLKSSTLTISAAFKYTVEDLSDVLKPYAVFGPAYYVQGAELRNGRIAGQVPLAPELGDLDVPDSWFEPEAGVHLGLGFTWEVSRRFFLGADGRYNKVGDKNNDFGTVSGELGFRF